MARLLKIDLRQKPTPLNLGQPSTVVSHPGCQPLPEIATFQTHRAGISPVRHQS